MISWNLITLNRRLRFLNIYHHDKNVAVDEVTEAIKKDCGGHGQLLGYCAMYHKKRQVDGLNVTRDQGYAAMTDVNTYELENRKLILKKERKKGAISSVGPNWTRSMDRHDKLMGYRNCTFSLEMYKCMDRASRKLLFIRAWASNSNPVYTVRWYSEYFHESKTLLDLIIIDKQSETTIMAKMQAFLSNKRPNI